MKSPFPGMDPYLEARWSDVHATLIAMIKEALQPNLPVGLRARTEERVLLEQSNEEEDNIQAYRADVAVVETRLHNGPRATASTATVPEPLHIHFYDAPEAERWIQIIDSTSGNRVITSIEVLSPWNKWSGRLNKLYRKKLKDYEDADVSVVEIDLLRGDRIRLRVTQEDLPPARRTAYLTCVQRAWVVDEWEAYPMKLQEPLPSIPIPLRQSDPDAVLALQPLIERVYVAGAHDDIDYSKPAKPPLEGEDEAWADQLLRRAGLRS
jgi:hypothetical protein